MKKNILMIAISFAALAASLMISDSTRVRIASSEALAQKLEQHSITIDPRTERTIVNLVASMRTHGPLADERWESRRQVTIERLESFLSDMMAQQESGSSH